jgi:hypothetical protein
MPSSAVSKQSKSLFWGARTLKIKCASCSKLRKLFTSLHDFIPFGRIMAMGSTEPVTEISNRSISWVVKAAGA